MRAMTSCICSGCGKTFDKLTSYVKRSKTGKHYCSLSCQLRVAKCISLDSRRSNRLEYDMHPNTCENCGTILAFSRRNNRFCGCQCAAIFNQKNGGHRVYTDEDRKKLSVASRNNPWFTGEMTRLKEIKCQNCGKYFQPNSSDRKFCSRKCSDVGRDLSRAGGFRLRGGRGKQGWYKGFFCGSSWELAWVIFQLEHGVEFSRNTVGFEYTFDGETHQYYPDFLVGEKSYVEVKGYNSPQWEAKKKQFPHKLSVIGRDEIKPYLNYVVEKYGDDFTRLYEDANVA